MNTQGRTFGRNMYYYMTKKGMNEQQLADMTGYSYLDIIRIKDARLFVPKDEKRLIADVLEVPLDKLLDVQICDGVNDPVIECRGEFSSPERKNTILDLFDTYCDIQEIYYMGKRIS